MTTPDSVKGGRGTARWKRILWGGLPDFLAVVPLVWCFSFAITSLYVGAKVGRQSSTAGIGPGLAILAAPFLAAIGLMLGRLVRRLPGAGIPDQWVRPLRWAAVLMLCVVGVLASRHASGPIHAAEREAQPRVLVNVAQIHRHEGIQTAGDLKRATRIYSHLEKVNRPIQWEGRSVELANAGENLELRYAPTAVTVRMPLPGIDYINHVDAIPLQLGTASRPALALLITGRATGRRDLIAVVSPAGELLCLELLDRFWDYRQVPLAIISTAAGDVVLVGTEPQRMLAFVP